MGTAAHCFAALIFFALTSGEFARAAVELPLRQPPMRSSAPNAVTPTAAPKLAPLAVKRFNKIEYVELADVAAQLGYKSAWDDKTRELTLTNGVRKLVFTTDRREIACDGLRLFLAEPVQSQAGKHYVDKIDCERCLLTILRPDLAGPLPGPVKVIAIDPGHGGNDPGMESETQHLQEKNLTLDVALRLEKLLLAAGYKVVLTRRDDRQLGPTKAVDWMQRGLIANQAGADLLVSVHFNSLFPNTHVGGTETFVFTRTGQRSDQSLGAAQPDDSEKDPAPVNRFDPWSSLLADSMQKAALKKLGTSDRGQKTKHSAVLRGLNCPGILIESVFLSNEAEAKRAATPAFRQQIAEAIADGIRAYAASLDSLRPNPPPTTATAVKLSNPLFR